MQQRRSLIHEYKGPTLIRYIGQPAPFLKEYIDYFSGEESLLDNYPSSRNPYYIMFPPSGFVEMHFCYHDSPVRVQSVGKSCVLKSMIVGERNIYTQHYVDCVKTSSKAFHVKFKPGGFYKIFGIPEGELRNNFFETHEVLGQEGQLFEDRMNNSVSIAERIGIVERFFIDKINARQRGPNMDGTMAALDVIVKSHGNLKIGNILKEMDISKRTLDRQFINHVGLSPKEFARVVRFKEVLNKISMADLVDWCELAESNGYYDQAHLIDEFKAATTLSPEKFLKEKGKTVVKRRNWLCFEKPTEAPRSSYEGLIKDVVQNEAVESRLHLASSV